MGRVPLYPGCRDERYPGVSSWESLEHIGPMSRTVADAALMLSVIARPRRRATATRCPSADFDWLERARPGDLKGLRVAYSPDWGYAAVDPEVRRVVGEAVEVFERDLGCTVEEAHPGWEDPFATFWALVALESDLDGHAARWRQGREHEMSPHLRRPSCSAAWTAEEFTDAVIARKAVVQQDVAVHARLRPAAHADARRAAVPGPHARGREMIDGRMVPSRRSGSPSPSRST